MMLGFTLTLSQRGTSPVRPGRFVVVCLYQQSQVIVSTDQICLLHSNADPSLLCFSGSGKLNNSVGVLIDGFKLYQIIKHNDIKMEAIFPAGHILLVTLPLPPACQMR